MKQVVIKKIVGALGDENDINIIWDEKPLTVFKKGENEISFDITKTERTIQAEIIDESGRSHRSNAYFVLNGKCPTLFLHVNGYRLKLTINE